MIPHRISGIPCLIEVNDCTVVPAWKGPASTAPSDLDYRGYTEIDFTICDRKGRPAKWLEDKTTEDERAEIEEKILVERQACQDDFAYDCEREH